MKKLNKRGFTLIELLVVIAIIGLLSTLAVVAFGNTRIKARDAKRQSDLKVLQTAVEMYIADNGSVPGPGTVAAATTPSAPDAATDKWDGAAAYSLEGLLATYLPGGLPEDPSGTARDWIYCYWDSAGTNLISTGYMVATSLERNQLISGDIDSGTDWVAADCIGSDDGFSINAAPNCNDNGAGVIDDNTATNAVCLGRPTA